MFDKNTKTTLYSIILRLELPYANATTVFAPLHHNWYVFSSNNWIEMKVEIEAI